MSWLTADRVLKYTQKYQILIGINYNMQQEHNLEN